VEKLINLFLKPKIPFIITSNKHPRDLGYKDVDMEIWTERMLIIELDSTLAP